MAPDANNWHGPLAGLKVLDKSSGIAGAFCAKQLADAGASITRLEPPEGSPLRRWSMRGPLPAGIDGPLFRFLSGGSRSLVVENQDISDLVGGFDILIDDNVEDQAQRLRESHPSLIVTTITPFGMDGPWAARPASEFTLQGWCGSLLSHGSPDEPPVQTGGQIGEWASGMAAAVGTLAAVRMRRASNLGDHVDVSMFEAMSMSLVIYPYLYAALAGWPEGMKQERMVETPGCEQTADGWIGLCCISKPQSTGFWEIAGRPELVERPELLDPAWRSTNRTLVTPLFADKLRSMTTKAVLDRAVELRIPASAVMTAGSLMENEHLLTRGAFVENPHGFLQPRPAYRLGDHPRRPPTAAPAIGERGTIPPASHNPPPLPRKHVKPLVGLRVLDLTNYLAGPYATHILAGLGADVIKVEGPKKFDTVRVVSSVSAIGDAPALEQSPVFHGANSGKRGMTLDLETEQGKSILRALIPLCDVLIENGTPRFFDKLGLSWELCHDLNPAMILVRMPAFGLDGPWRDRPGFAQTMEQVSGMAMATGYPDGPPLNPRGPADPIQGMQAAIALLAALELRDQQGGKGCLVEVPMIETVLSIVSPGQLEQSAFGEELSRMGNRSLNAAPQGLYPCQGTENWLAISIETDAQWRSLVDLLKRPDLQDLTLAERIGRHDEIDGVLENWSQTRTLTDALDSLLQRGIPAAPAADGYRLHFNEQMIARGFFEPVDHAVAGQVSVPGLPFSLASVDHWLEHGAPTLGQHNHEILRELLGMSNDEIRKLEEAEII